MTMMEEMPRRRQPRSFDDMPEWVRELKGTELFTDSPGEDSLPDFRSGVWRTQLVLPVDPADLEDQVDPLLLLIGLALAAADIETKTVELVNFCRSRGKSWAQIGEVLGMTKQAAWERFSAEN